MNYKQRLYEILKDWKKKNQYRAVFQVCVPLVMSTGAITVMEFTDRVFLANYSLDAISAATPSGIVALLFIAFFSGVSGYGSVFIAQYSGTGALHRVGAALWQAVFFAVLSGIALVGISFLAVPIFELSGHPSEIQRLEVIYFKILCWGAVLHVIGVGLSSFFIGRGKTRPVMVINTIGMIFNIPLDYALINGVWVFPELGISGAAIATVSSWGLILVLYALLIFSKTNDRKFHVRKASTFDKNLFYRLMKFGIPGAIQFCMDIFAFMFFVLMVGRIGKIELAASNIVISINSLAFMPAIGFSQGVSTLVGRALGQGQPQQANYAVWSALHVLLAYTAVLVMLYLFAPQWVLSLFIPPADTGQAYTSLSATGRILLQIVAAYVFLDAFYLTFIGALRGAGDTRFIMWSIGLASLGVMVLPVLIGIEYFQMGIYSAWLCVLMFVASLFILSSWRYWQGKWQKMLVVEKEVTGSTSVF
jgi:MATE family multidrug resistance protein